jgi:hypothetical protein
VVVPTFDSLELISHDEHAQTYKSWQGCEVVVRKCGILHERPVMEGLRHEAMIYQVFTGSSGAMHSQAEDCWNSGWHGGAAGVRFCGDQQSARKRLGDSDQEKIWATLSAIHMV